MNATIVARKAIESIYDSACTVTEYQSTKDQKTKRTMQQEVSTLEGQPCRVSFKATLASRESDVAGTISQTIKLFIAPELSIKPGSKITVTSGSRESAYKSSGVPAIYNTHQEIELELFEGWT